MRVIYISRAKNFIFYSIERVFNLVIRYLPDSYKASFLELPQKGVSLKNVFFILQRVTFLGKGCIFHVTGDVHYISLLLPRKKTVLTIHDCGFTKTYQGLKKWILKKILLDWPVKYVKHITTISEKTKAEIIQHTGCRPEKITVIPNPVSNKLYYVEKPFNKENLQILFIGSTPNKNLERVTVALKDIPCYLRIIGKISNKHRQLLTDNTINFSDISGISEQELNEEYCKSDIVLFPSLYEGFGLPIIEAQKTGRVVISSNIAPMDEVAGEGACLVDPYSIESIREGILKVTEDDAYRNSLIQEGFKNVERFSAEKITDQYLALYKQIASKN